MANQSLPLTPRSPWTPADAQNISQPVSFLSVLIFWPYLSTGASERSCVQLLIFALIYLCTCLLKQVHFRCHNNSHQASIFIPLQGEEEVKQGFFFLLSLPLLGLTSDPEYCWRLRFKYRPRPCQRTPKGGRLSISNFTVYHFLCRSLHFCSAVFGAERV